MFLLQQSQKTDKLNLDYPIPIITEGQILPVHFILTETKFFRVGNDLEIKTLDDSRQIKDYFINPASIKTLDGMILSFDEVIAKLSYSTEPILLAANDTTNVIYSNLEKIGTITVAIENATAQTKDGTTRILNVGEPVYLYDTIVTTAHSYVKITLNDGTVFQLGPHARARLEKYAYESDGSVGEFETYVYSGTFRYVSGKISGDNQGQHTTIKTPSAQINIRGSEIDAQIGADGSTTVLHLSGLISIIPHYHLTEILVYERGTSVYIPIEDISHRIKTLTEEQIQQRSDEWQVFDHSDSVKSTLHELGEGVIVETPNTSEDVMPPPLDVGALHPFSPGTVDVHANESVDELISDNGIQAEIEMINRPQPVAPGDSPLTDKAPFLPKDLADSSDSDGRLSPPEEEDGRPQFIPENEGHLPDGEPFLPEPLPEPIREFTLNEDEPSEKISVGTGIITQIVQPENGEVVDNGDGTLTYMPNPNYNGDDSFSYTLGTDSVQVNLTINPVNDAPIAVADQQITDEDIALVLDPAVLLENDIDVDGDELFITSVDLVIEPSNSMIRINNGDSTSDTLFLNDKGKIEYQPAQDFYGQAEFIYTIQDTQGEQDTASVIVTMMPVNDAPIAVADIFHLETATSLTLSANSLLDNDRDIDNEHDALQFVEVLHPINGAVSLNNGEIVFSFINDKFAQGSFDYIITDGDKTALGQVTLTRTFDNLPPNALNDVGPLFNMGNSDTIIIKVDDLLNNDSDPDGDLITFDNIITNSGVNGIAIIDANGDIIFTRGPDFDGTGQFEYQISDGKGGFDSALVTVIGNVIQPPNGGPVNHLPVAEPDSVSTFKNEPIVISSLLDNDNDPDADIITINEVINPNQGQIELDEVGNVKFTPTLDFTGLASFEYTIKDSQGAISLPTRVEIEVINRPLVNHPPVAVDDSLFSTEVNQPLSILSQELLTNDSDPDGDAIILERVDNATNGSVELVGGNVLFTPASDFEGEAFFNYTIKDSSGETASAIVSVSVKKTSIALDDEITQPRNTTGTFNNTFLLSNDIGEGLTITNVENAIHGNVTLLDNGSIQFVAEKGFEGDASFEYTVIDALGNSDKATVIVKLDNLAPVAVDDGPLTVQQNSELQISKEELLSNDWDINSDKLTIIAMNNPENGTVVDNGENVVFMPTTGFLGEASFEYSITDGDAQSKAAIVNITVTPNLAPVITLSDTTPLIYNNGTELVIDSAATVTDPDSPDFQAGILQVLITENRTPTDLLEIQNIGEISVSSKTDGTISYNGKPIGNFLTNFITGALLVKLNDSADPDATTALLQAITYRNISTEPTTETRTITITLSDGDGATSEPVSREIEIPPPITPLLEAVDDSVSVPFNTVTRLSTNDLLANDQPANPADILTISELNNLSEGVEATLVGNEVQLFIDGLLNDPSKPVTFNYTVNDNLGNEDTATVTMTPSNVIMGTSEDDTLAGTDNLDVIIGQEGNDIFAPSVGSDILLGGDGDDLFLFDPNSAPGVQIIGGNGTDTLSFNEAEGKALDLIQNRALPSDQQLDLQSIEKIDLSGNNNQLRLSIEDVLEFSDSNRLTIEGDASSFVNSVTQGWNNEGIDSTGFYNLYTAGETELAELLVSVDIANQFIS